MSKISPVLPPSNPQRMLEAFSTHVLKATKRNQKLNPYDFSDRLKAIGDVFVNQNQIEVMNKGSRTLAERLVAMNNLQFAGRVYSFLIKLNKGNDKAVEEYATNALAIAKRLHDPIHIMARTNDLKEIYKKSPNDKYLSLLFEEKRALNLIIKDYARVKQQFETSRTKMKPVENYEAKLAAIKLEIAEICLSKGDKHSAKNELREALAIYQKLGTGPNSEKIEKLLLSL